MTNRTKRKILSGTVGLIAALTPMIIFGYVFPTWQFVVCAIAIDGAYFLGYFAKTMWGDNE